METTSEGKTAAKTISHYAGPGEALTWTNEGSEKWSRNIPAIGGSLTAIQKSSEQPTLQLRDLKGDIIATAALNETETKLLSTYNSTEFGVPQSGTTAPPYSWLGALDISSSLPTSGTVTTGASSYEPMIGRPLQTEPTASPGAFPDGTGGAGIVRAPYLGADNNQLKAIAVQEAAEEAKAKNLEAEEHARENGCPASACGTSEGNLPTPTEGGTEEEGESIIGYLPFEHGGGGAHTAGHIECGVAEGNGLPHESSQNPGFVNWTIKFICNAPVLDVRVRLALFWEGKEVSETGYVEVGTTAYWKESVQTPCVSGWYTGWVYVDLVPPPGYEGDRVFKSWSKASRYVNCEP